MERTGNISVLLMTFYSICFFMEREFFDVKWLEELCSGSIRFGRLMELHAAITRRALHFTNEPEIARDIASDCLAEYWFQAVEKKCMLSGECLEACLTHYYKKLIVADRRRQSAEAKLTDDSALNRESDALVIARYQEDLLQLTKYLDPFLRQVIEMNLIQELSLQEISEIVSKPSTTIKSARDLAIYQLRQIRKSKKNYRR